MNLMIIKMDLHQAQVVELKMMMNFSTNRAVVMTQMTNTDVGARGMPAGEEAWGTRAAALQAVDAVEEGERALGQGQPRDLGRETMKMMTAMMVMGIGTATKVTLDLVALQEVQARLLANWKQIAPT